MTKYTVKVLLPNHRRVFRNADLILPNSLAFQIPRKCICRPHTHYYSALMTGLAAWHQESPAFRREVYNLAPNIHTIHRKDNNTTIQHLIKFTKKMKVLK